MKDNIKIIKILVNLSANMKVLRAARGWTQVTLSHHAKLHFTYISQIERCKRPEVSIRTVVKICDALEVTIGDIFRDVEKEIKNDR